MEPSNAFNNNNNNNNNNDVFYSVGIHKKVLMPLASIKKFPLSCLPASAKNKKIKTIQCLMNVYTEMVLIKNGSSGLIWKCLLYDGSDGMW